MKLDTIKTEEEYKNALIRLEEIFHAEKGSEEGKELKSLLTLIEKYETNLY